MGQSIGKVARRSRPMQRHEWASRILDELRQIDIEPGPPHLIWLNDLGFSMLEGYDSRAGVEWLKAVRDLQESGSILIDAANYVAVTDRGRVSTRAAS